MQGGEILLRHIELKKSDDAVQVWVSPLKAFKNIPFFACGAVKNVCLCM